MSSSTVGYGDPSAVCGKERKGKPSRHVFVSTRPAPRWGTANLNRFANRRTPGEPGEWITEAGRGSRQHPGGTRQTPTRSPRNLQKSIAKSFQNLVRKGPRSLRNRSGTLPERVRAKKTQKIEKVCSQNKCENFWDRLFGIFGVRPGAQNRQKTSPGAKKCVRRRRRKRFLSFFLAGAVRSRSPDRFWLDFSPKITPESREFFHAST